MAKSKASDDMAMISDVPAFEVLRERVDQAVKEIQRLRKKNDELAAQVKKLKAKGGDEGFSLAVDGETQEELKARIEGFIETINGVLGETAEAAN